MSFGFTESLAGTGRTYVTAQVRVREEEVHFQVYGPSVNRSYGWAFDLPLDSSGNILHALCLLGAETVSSLANTGRAYLPVQIYPYEDCLHVQVELDFTIPDHEASRSYGAAVDLPAPDFLLERLSEIIASS